MKMRAENFFNPLFGKMVEVVLIVVAKSSICFPDDAADQDYTNVVNANANLP